MRNGTNPGVAFPLNQYTCRLLDWSCTHFCQELLSFCNALRGTPPCWTHRRVLAYMENSEGSKLYSRTAPDHQHGRTFAPEEERSASTRQDVNGHERQIGTRMFRFPTSLAILYEKKKSKL